MDFNGFNTLLAIHGKRLNGSVGDNLTSAQIDEINRKKLNYYQKYGTVGYVTNGWAVDGQFIDINYGLDWMVNAMEIEVFNALTATRRVPQTPAGLAVVEGAIRTVCEQAYRNGMIDGGTFSDPVAANIRRATGNNSFDGVTVKGYLIYIGSPLAAQSQVNRAARKAPPISVWLKSAGNNTVQPASICYWSPKPSSGIVISSRERNGKIRRNIRWHKQPTMLLSRA